MKKSKINKGIRLLSIMLSLVMAFSIMPVTVREASASDSDVTASGTCGDNLTWVLTDDGTLTISGTGDMTDYSSSSIPWYSYRGEIVKVVIESGVTGIGNYAFAYCGSLEETDFADTLKSIGNGSFLCCYTLLNAELPADIESIGNSAFYFCHSLQSISLSESLTDIGNYAFYYCEDLSSVEIPENVTSIGQRAFDSCFALTEVIFAGDAPQIGTNVWECVKYFRYHSSKSGWEDAIASWSVPDGAVWYDLDSMISASDFSITSELSLSAGESQTITTNADDYISSTFSWSSSDSSVAYVSQDGTVTGLSAGTAVVTVQTEDGTYKAQCTVTVTETSSSLPTVNTVISDSTVSNNISDNNYSVWSSTVKSCLYENDDGTLTRVEYISGTGVVVETIDQSTGQASSVTTLEMELSIWGGFYSGEEYNFLVFGQTNYDEDDSTEVLRIVKYSKSWERISSCSVYGANTYVPFDAGSLRMMETNGSLYVYTCHTMYASSDGLNHQANMTFVIDESTMSVTDSYFKIMNNSYGYVSHSFNQFIQTDGDYIYRVDHGDAYPRGIYLSKVAVGDSVTDVSYTTTFEIQGTTGANATGVSIGGMELSVDNVIIVGNSVDQSDSDTYSASGQRNIFIIVTDKEYLNSETIWLTDYTEDDGITPRTPQLVSVASDIFLIMWEEVDSDGSITTKLVLVDADGNLISDITELSIRLSDCQPVVTEDGIVTWYVTNGYRTTLYQINPFSLSETEITAESIASAAVTLSKTSYTYDGTAKTPSVTVTAADGTVLTKGVDYTVSYSNNTDAGTAVVTVTGIGSFTGTVTAEFTINGISLSTSKTVVTLAESEFIYTGSAFQPEVTSVTYNGTELTEGVDYTISYGENTNKGYGYVYITGIGNYTGSRTSYFTITAQSLSESNATLEYESTTYTGSSLKPSVTVTNAAGTTLTSGTDYSVSYSNNKSVGTATVTVTGKGNYTGTVTKTFTVEAQSLSSSNVTLGYSSAVYTGSALTPSVTVKNAAGSTLTNGTDYTVSYSDNTEVGTATVTITGMGNYTGTVTAEFTIAEQSLSSSNVTLEYSSITYTGSALTPSVTVKNSSGTTLTNGTDYTVSYSDNTSVGTATVTVTGTGKYTGTVTKTFTIKTQSLSSSNVTLDYSSTTYTGSALTPSVTVTNAAGTTLTSGTDYSVSYSNNTSVGTATVRITGKGNYTGTVTATFTITAQSLSESNVTLEYESTSYTGSSLKPSVTVTNAAGTTLTSGTDYTVSYSNNKSVGTATVTITGKGNYTGTITKTFTITAASDSSDSSGNSSSGGTSTDDSTDSSGSTVESIKSAAVTLSTTSYTYNGSARKPTPTVVLSGTTLTKGTDYTVSYSNNTNAGTATVTITGTGNYTGTVTATFTIIQKTISSTSSAAKVTLSTTSYTYSGVSNKPTPTVKITLNGSTKTLTKGKDYTVSYKNNTNAGTATVTITGTGNYKGTLKKTFTIKAKSISSASATLSYTSTTYTGKAKKPSVSSVKISLKQTYTVTSSSGGTRSLTLYETKKLTKGTDYTVTYKNNTKAGTATVTITGKGNYKGTLKKTFTIKKASQTLKATYSSSKTVKYSKVKSAKQTVKAITKVSGAKGKVTYTKSSGSKYLSVSKTTGKITVKKGTPKGTYKIKVKIKSAATTNYKSASKTVTITVKVK